MNEYNRQKLPHFIFLNEPIKLFEMKLKHLILFYFLEVVTYWSLWENDTF